MLSHRTANDAQVIRQGMNVEIGYYDVKTGVWNKVDESDSYNWPQGSMLQWIPGAGNENKLIFNLSKDNRLISRIHDIRNGESKDINWPIYGLTPDGKKSISIDLERSHFTIAYHYESVVNQEKNQRIAPGDGIFEIDLELNTKKCIISITDIISVDFEPYFDNCRHWLEHVMVSPSGKRFCFLHRFSPMGNDNVRITRLCVADIDGSNLQVIDNWRNFAWSHFGWNSDDTFSIYTYEKKVKPSDMTIHPIVNHTDTAIPAQNNSIKTILANLIPVSLKDKVRILLRGQKSYYQYYELKGNRFCLKQSWRKFEFSIDGHQNFTHDCKYMIADSYPDGNCYQHLMIYNVENGKLLTIAKIYAGLHRKPGTCDLHPKLCRNNNLLMVDSAYNGKHHILLFELDWKRITNKLK